MSPALYDDSEPEMFQLKVGTALCTKRPCLVIPSDLSSGIWWIGDSQSFSKSWVGRFRYVSISCSLLNMGRGLTWFKRSDLTSPRRTVVMLHTDAQ